MATTTETSAVPTAFEAEIGRSAAEKETLRRWFMRWVLGIAWCLKPPRFLGVPATLWMVLSHYAGFRHVPGKVPDPETALKCPDGLVAICSDLEVDTLMAGYRAGLYPFCHIGPQKWLAPSQRMVLTLDNFHMEKNLKRLLRKKVFSVTFDKAFDDVMKGCADPRPGRPHLTWITPAMIDAFVELHEAGHAHSVEVWDEVGNLVGGAYGVAVGRVFFTESQFSRQSNASKIGFATLNCHLQKWGFLLNDGKLHTPYLEQAGFELMPRKQFNALIARYRDEDVMPGTWGVDPSLDVGNWDPSAGPSQFHAQVD